LDELRTSGSVGGHALGHLSYPFGFLPLLSQRPTAQDRTLGQKEWEPLLTRVLNIGLCPLAGLRALSSILMEPGGMIQAIAKLNG
jgi:hypothetical protein